MYCDIHRLFLQMAKEYKEVLKTANEELKQFIEVPAQRTRAKTPDLGDLILYPSYFYSFPFSNNLYSSFMVYRYLTITPDYSWEDLKRAYIQESFRRGARFIRTTAGHIPLQALDSEEKLFDYWMRGTSGGRVTMFSIINI